MDLKAERDIEEGRLSHTDEDNLSQFFQEVEAIKENMTEITNLFVDLQSLNEETKTTHSAKILRGLRDRMDSDIVSVLHKAKIVRARLEALDKSNMVNRRISVRYSEGSAVDRTRISTTKGLRAKLRDIMNDFQVLREKILSDYKDSLKRRYYNATGEVPSEEVIDKMVSENGKKSLNKLHQVFIDMAVLVETQGERIDDIEHNVANGKSFVSGGTSSLFYAKQMKKRKKWIYWVWGIGIIILLVCFIAMLTS
ncbi:Syntaxin [Abeliophyllum distichum]|uniref:Syntaxin n=1 Tax=Abeliophyllum distichum TaxID=126358 RepID=A0ABD1V4M0_9LAMI